MLRSLVALTVLAAAPVSLRADDPRPKRPIGIPISHGMRPAIRSGVMRTPGIRIWTSGDDLVRRGERVRVFYRTERDAYVTIFRVDTDGRVKVIFPRHPDDENYGYGGATYSVSSAGQGTAFYVDDYAGVGYIFGIASTAPFNYDAVYGDGRWDLHAISDGRIHGDPLTSLEELSLRMLPESFGDFDTHLLPYYVEQRYSYPRFVCYDCHTYVPYTHWDPYLNWCRRFTLVVWNDPWYYYPSYWYPTRYYGGTRVVYTSPGGSRYVFKNRENSSPGIDYRDRRTTPTATAQSGGGRRVVEDRGARGVDVGGVGSIPAPRSTGRRTVEDSPRDGGRDGGFAPGAVGSGNDGRRRAEGAQSGGASPSPVPVDAGGRRRSDDPPGIEIVPRPERPDRPSAPQGSGRRGAESPNDGARPTQPDAPVSRRMPETSGEARPPRPDAPSSRPAPIEVSKPSPDRPDRRAEPEARPAPEGRPSPETRRAPESAPVPRPERQPESRPERQPESRPERQPESRPAPQRQPESRPAPQPQPESRPAPQQRQPESRPAPQSRPAPSAPQSSGGGRRRDN